VVDVDDVDVEITAEQTLRLGDQMVDDGDAQRGVRRDHHGGGLSASP
jgi:hypothetical protein